MGTIGEALTSIVVSRYILNLRELNRSGVTSNMTCCSRMSVSIQFVLSHDTDSNPRPSYENNLSQRFMNFVEPLSAPVEGFLAEGLLKGDEEDNVQYILDVAEVWNDALEKSEDELLEV
ncbi:hypothetical protein BD309DRAFT_969192 [Dichomitus squalens]|nr:hypothetical protein BD309DRAFT_969192 [Dichomitus squalens]